ncbi:MAG: TMEM165/GDT1 family protein [Candidatus Brocadiaceae bacterium]|uniref:TMEM165/GDT1 family protein n=1 Tax=Candidatus Wunengus sp. YC61 TaxID=3367698 RepID=UPI002722C1E8|nr:TMEM165/GDT1 family protein [Candidatus Brocadiaceae bacterium]
MLSFVSSFFLIAIAEMGDKTQLVALSFATKYKPTKVLLGIFIGTIVVHLFSVIIGERVCALIPLNYLKILIGLSFVGFGIWTLKGDSCNEKEKKGNKLGPILTVAIAFFLAELGDKTQLATISLAAQYHSFLGVWLGSTFGMVAADGIAIVVGIIAGKKLPEKLIKYVSTAIFIIFGALIIIDAVR